MKILLLNAPPLKQMGIVGQIYPPLGILYLASYARSQFKNLDFLVIDGYKTRKKNLFEKIWNFNPDVVGVSYTTQASTGAYEIINEIKKRYEENVLLFSIIL